MKKRIRVCIFGFALAVVAVLAVGMLQKGALSVSENKDADTKQLVSESGTEASASDTDAAGDDEQEWLEQTQKDSEKIEREGNVFSKDSYQIYNGYGFMVSRFEIFNSYGDFANSEDYNSDYTYMEPDEAESGQPFVFVEYRVTNEDRYEKKFLITKCKIVCADCDGTLEGSLPEKGYWGFNSDGNYYSRVDNWEELTDEKEWWYFPIQPGETITLQMGYIFTYGTTTGEDVTVGSDVVFDDPRYYMCIEGNMSSDGELKNIENDANHIYIELE